MFLGHLKDVAESTEGGVAAARWQKDALGASAVAADESSGAQQQLGTAVAGATGKLDKEVKSLSDLLAETQKVTGYILGLRDANRAYEAAIDGAAQALKDNGKTLDVHTAAGRANSASLDAIAESAGKVLQGMADTRQPVEALSAKLKEQRKVLEDQGVRFGMSREAARQYAESLLKIPKAAPTKVQLDAAAAKIDLKAVRDYMAGIDGKVVSATVRIGVNGLNDLAGAAAKLDRLDSRGTRAPAPAPAPAVHKAAGGFVYGPGPRDSDALPGLPPLRDVVDREDDEDLAADAPLVTTR